MAQDFTDKKESNGANRMSEELKPWLYPAREIHDKIDKFNGTLVVKELDYAKLQSDLAEKTLNCIEFAQQITEIEGTIESLRKQVEWKPISAAPKDGKMKLWYFPESDGKNKLREMVTVETYKPCCHRQPTLWMYVTLPKTAKAERGE